MGIPITELDPELIAKLGLSKEVVKPREYKFTMDQPNHLEEKYKKKCKLTIIMLALYVFNW